MDQFPLGPEYSTQVVDRFSEILEYKMQLLEVSIEFGYVFIGIKDAVRVIPLDSRNRPKVGESFDLRSKQCPDEINCIHLTKTDKTCYLLTANMEGMIAIYDISRLSQTPFIIENVFAQARDNSVWSLDTFFKESCLQIACGSNAKIVSLYKLEETTEGLVCLGAASTFKFHTNNIPSVSFSLDGEYLASACIDGFVRIYKTSTTELIKAIQTISEYAWCVRWSADYLYVGRRTRVEVIDLKDFTLTQSFLPGSGNFRFQFIEQADELRGIFYTSLSSHKVFCTGNSSAFVFQNDGGEIATIVGMKLCRPNKDGDYLVPIRTWHFFTLLITGILSYWPIDENYSTIDIQF